ncbi:hypothetical protein BDK51DRAFT_28769, partial [Blyttiomyces helicus]
IFGYHILAAIYLESRAYDSAVDCGVKAQGLVAIHLDRTGEGLPSVSQSLDFCLAEAYMNLGAKTLPKALAIYKEILGRDPSDVAALEGLGKTLCALQTHAEAILCFEKVLRLEQTRHSARSEIGWIRFLQGDFDAARATLEEALAGEETALTHLRVGRVVWGLGDKPLAHTHLLRAAKLDPNLALAFTHLGHYYSLVEQDAARAIKCYRRSLALDPADEDASRSLVTLLLKKDQVAEGLAVLEAFSKISGRVAWVWKMIGVVYLVQQSYPAAIASFQTALRLDAKDLQSWTSLAEAYSHQGKHMAALKAFARALELDPECATAHHEVARIRHRLGLFAAAAEGFEANILRIGGDTAHLPSLAALCESLLCWARESHAAGAYGRCADLLARCIARATEGIHASGPVAALLKTLADAAIAMANLVPAHAAAALDAAPQAVILGAVFPLDPAAAPSNSPLDTILRLGETACSITLSSHAAPQDLAAARWHDLALCRFLRWRDRPDDEAMLALAVRAIRAAIRAQPRAWMYWNALGVMSVEAGPKVAQHAFIKAIECDPRTPVPWANFGYLCHLRGDLELAHEAFSKAQFVDPDWALAWLGQAFVARRMGSGEAFELFEHARELGGNGLPEALYEFATESHRHTRTLPTSSDPSTRAAAAFAALKTTEHNPTNTEAHAQHALILELQHRPSLAASAYRAALENLPPTSPHRAKVLENLARAACAAKEYDAAVEAYAALHASGGEESAASKVGEGLALFYVGRLEESLRAFEAAIAKGGAEAGEVGVAVGQVLYALGSEAHVRLAGEQFLQCFRNDPRNLKSLLALCSLGLVRGDAALAQSAAAEIVRINPEDAGGLDADVDWVLSRFFLAQGNLKAAKGFLAKSVHRYPSRADRWAKLTDMLYRYAPDALSPIIATTATSATLPSPPHPGAIPITIGIALLATASTLRRITARTALHRAVRAAPHNPRTWLGLALQARADAALTPSVSRCTAAANVANAAGAVGDDDGVDAQWAHLIRADALAAGARIVDGAGSDDLDVAGAIAERVAIAAEANPRLRAAAFAVVARVRRTRGDVAGAVAGYKGSLDVLPANAAVWQELASTYATLSLFTAADLCHRQTLSTLPATSPTKLPALLRLARQAISLSTPALASEAIAEALIVDPASTVPRRLQALLQIRTGGAAKAVKALAAADPHELWVNWILAEGLRAKGEEAEAREALMREVALQPVLEAAVAVMGC